MNLTSSNREAEFYGLIVESAERAFHCFKANFSKRIDWPELKKDLIKYMYRDSKDQDTLLSLTDDDLIAKLSIDLRRLTRNQIVQLSESPSIKPLNKSRIRRYQSISSEEELSVQQRPRSIAMHEQSTSTHAINALLEQKSTETGLPRDLGNLQDTSSNDMLAQLDSYQPSPITPAKKEANQSDQTHQASNYSSSIKAR
jgi:hypothetical protein